MEDARSQKSQSSDLTRTAVSNNSFKSLSVSVDATGFRTNALRCASMLESNAQRLAEEFLLNTALVRNDKEFQFSAESYFSDTAAVMLSLLGEEETGELSQVRLPEGAALQMELGDVLSRRRSVRTYTGDKIGVDRLATLLRAAAGITAHVEVALAQAGEVAYRFRATPSAGGLYPVDLYVAVLSVTGLERGIYRYDPIKDFLVKVGDGAALNTLLSCFAVDDELISISRANLIFLMIGQPWKVMRKYGNRGMRFLFHEVGAMSQNIHLAAVGLGLGSVDCTSVYDAEANEAIHVDGLFQSLVHTVIVGNPG